MFCKEEIDLRGCYPARPLVFEDNTPFPPTLNPNPNQNNPPPHPLC